MNPGTAAPSGLAGRHVLVTGGSGGLGPAVVEAFVAAGAVVHVPTRGDVPAGARALPRVDLTSEDAVAALFAALPPLWASVHVAGGFLFQPLLETTLADVRGQLDVNFTTAFLCTREAARQMQGRAGRIVNVTSAAVEHPSSGMGAYIASKGAVAAFTRAAARELREAHILVNAVAPTIVDTPKNRAAMPGVNPSSWTGPAQIARAIVWLASPDNETMSGAVLPLA